MERETYVVPTVELFEMAVEQGFAGSVTAEVEGFEKSEWE